MTLRSLDERPGLTFRSLRRVILFLMGSAFFWWCLLSLVRG